MKNIILIALVLCLINLIIQCSEEEKEVYVDTLKENFKDNCDGESEKKKLCENY